ncbi:MAG: potassium-transporting ATPase subunit A [Planctomycetes bacterium]|nr:potassium-transporting ATPase subunit A [Planctomycetota bacterium]
MSWTIPTLMFLACAAASVPLGHWLAWSVDDASSGVRARLDRALRLVGGERALRPRDWRGYALSLLAFHAVLFTCAALVLTCQSHLPLDPDGKADMGADLAFHTAISFATNTNLQHYSGEVALSYLSQLVVVMGSQFLSAAAGLAVLAALCRGLAGRDSCGSFLRDTVRVALVVLLPLAFALALVLLACGVPMTLDGAAAATTLEGVSSTIARGPVAAVVAIKQLGTNGGGFFGANAAHPFENPGFASNLVENAAILLLPMAAVWMFGRMVASRRQAAVVFAVMSLLTLSLVGAAAVTEHAPAAALEGLPVASAPNLEGKELRFGSAAAPVWAVSTTATSNGSVDAMHDSLNPLTGLAPLAGMWLNVAFGGVGVGFVNVFLFVIVAVFVAGMMVGRTPEYLGKKVEAREMKLASLGLLCHPLLVLGGTALFAATAFGRDSVLEHGAHGFTEIVYEMSSAAANNGSGFEGLLDDTPAWNIVTGLVMLFGRFVPIVLPLAVSGWLAAKPRVAASAGTFRTDGAMFGVILAAVVIAVGALSFLPLAVLGPVAEHLAPR